jgi:hypothetical protein
MTEEQLGFRFAQMAEEERMAHLPSAFDETIPYYRTLIEKHHAAMMARDPKRSWKSAKARDLAHKLDPENHGILSGPEASGVVLARETAAAVGMCLYGAKKGITAFSWATCVSALSRREYSCLAAIQLHIQFSHLTQLITTSLS